MRGLLHWLCEAKKVNFTKVLKMIDDMIVLLNKEQKDDYTKKEYCRKTIGKTNDEKAQLLQDISDLKKSIDQNQQKLKSLIADIKSKTDNIKALDKQVNDATKA